MSLHKDTAIAEMVLDNDLELSRLYKEALHTLPCLMENKNNNDSLYKKVRNDRSIDIKRKSNVIRQSGNNKFHNNVNRVVKHGRSHIEKSTSSIYIQEVKKPRRDLSRVASISKSLKKPTVPKMSFELAVDVNRYFNTTKKVEHFINPSSTNFVEGVGTFNQEKDFEIIWELTVNHLEEMNKRIKKLHMELVIAENQYKNQLRSEKKGKDDMITVQEKFIKNLAFSNISYDRLELSPQLNEAMMTCECNGKFLNNTKMRYVGKFIEYKTFTQTYKQFESFFKNLSSYKKDYDNYSVKLEDYYNTIDRYKEHLDNKSHLNSVEEKIKNNYNKSSVSENKSNELLVSHGSLSHLTVPLLSSNEEDFVTTETMDVSFQNHSIHDDRNQRSDNVSSICYQPVRENLLPVNLSSDFRSNISNQDDHDKNVYISENNDSTSDINMSMSMDTNNEPQLEVMATKDEVPENIYDKDGDDDNRIIYLKEIPEQEIPLKNLSRPSLINKGISTQSSVLKLATESDRSSPFDCHDSLPNICNGSLKYNTTTSGFVNNSNENLPSSSHSLPKSPTNICVKGTLELQDKLLNKSSVNLTEDILTKFYSSVDEIDELMCYYDMYGECMDVRCHSLHQDRKNLLVECIRHCVISTNLQNNFNKTKNGRTETLASFVFCILKENNYNFDETVEKLNHFASEK